MWLVEPPRGEVNRVLPPAPRVGENRRLLIPYCVLEVAGIRLSVVKMRGRDEEDLIPLCEGWWSFAGFETGLRNHVRRVRPRPSGRAIFK